MALREWGGFCSIWRFWCCSKRSFFGLAKALEAAERVLRSPRAACAVWQGTTGLWSTGPLSQLQEIHSAHLQSDTDAVLCLGCSSTLLQLYPIKIWRHLYNVLAFTHSSYIFHFCFWACISAHKILNQVELYLTCSLRSGVSLILLLRQVQEVIEKEQNSLSNSCLLANIWR